MEFRLKVPDTLSPIDWVVLRKGPFYISLHCVLIFMRICIRFSHLDGWWSHKFFCCMPKFNTSLFIFAILFSIVVACLCAHSNSACIACRKLSERLQIELGCLLFECMISRDEWMKSSLSFIFFIHDRCCFIHTCLLTLEFGRILFWFFRIVKSNRKRHIFYLFWKELYQILCVHKIESLFHIFHWYINSDIVRSVAVSCSHQNFERLLTDSWTSVFCRDRLRAQNKTLVFVYLFIFLPRNICIQWKNLIKILS